MDKREGERRDPHARESKAVRQAIRSELENDGTSPGGGAAGIAAADKPPVVALDNVSLAFDVPILETVSFDAKEGETVAIVGESGTGKSTILKLILPFLLPHTRCVLIDRHATTAPTSAD